MRFLRNMSENDDRREERSRAVEKPGDGVEVVGREEGEAECGSGASVIH